jgi:hypothetical protein
MFTTLTASMEAAGSPQSKRKAVEALITKTITTLDPSGLNTKRYEAQFAKWTDTQFDSYLQGIKDGNIKLTLYVPNLLLNLKMKDIFQAATDLDLTLFEKLRLWDSTTRRYYLTPHKYPVLLLPVRRLKQFLMDKISVPESDTKIDAFSGQVSKPDKGASISSVEMQTILSKGLKTCISELIRTRGGDINQYSAFKGQLEETGAASLNSIDDDSRARSSVILSVYLTGMQLKNNL